HYDERPHRNQDARRRASYAVNQMARRCAEDRAEHEGLLYDVHARSTEQAAFLNRDGIPGGFSPWRGWGHGQTEQVFSRGAGPCSADGPGARESAHVIVGDD